jgi:hypothetical protein
MTRSEKWDEIRRLPLIITNVDDGGDVAGAGSGPARRPRRLEPGGRLARPVPLSAASATAIAPSD